MKNSTMKAKYSALALALLMAVLFLTGCTKTPVTTADFKAVAEKKGFLVEDVMAQFSEHTDIVKEATVTAPESIAFKLEFYVLSDESSARSFYANNKANLEANKGNADSNVSLSGKNYESFSMTTDGKYMFIERVDTTVLYVGPTDSANKAEIEAFVKELKY